MQAEREKLLKSVTRFGETVRYFDEYICGGHGVVEKRIFQVKQKRRLEIEYYVDLLDGHIPLSCTVCNVPSHDRRDPEPGVRRIVMGLTRSVRTNASGCLVRSKTIPKLSLGGERGLSVHLHSITLTNIDALRGQDVIIIDDIVTSGSSSRACKQIVSYANPKKVTLIALACV